ncbi:hypothetical protein BH10PSE4_BH10PSE4_21710 [soil metagenome]
MIDPLLGAEDDAATPLTPDERQDLIPAYIATRDDLNEAEELGIAAADRWAFSRKRDVLDEKFLLGLHGRMFKAVWKWAGRIRTPEANASPFTAELLHHFAHHRMRDFQYWLAVPPHAVCRAQR